MDRLTELYVKEHSVRQGFEFYVEILAVVASGIRNAIKDEFNISSSDPRAVRKDYPVLGGFVEGLCWITYVVGAKCFLWWSLLTTTIITPALKCT